MCARSRESLALLSERTTQLCEQIELFAAFVKAELVPSVSMGADTLARFGVGVDTSCFPSKKGSARRPDHDWD